MPIPPKQPSACATRCAAQAKLSSGNYRLHDDRVDVEHILTAAEAQVDLLLARVPRNARVLVLSGGEGSWRRDLERRGGAEGAALVATWDLRTSLTEEEAKGWASEAAKDDRASPSVFVVFFHDGSIGGSSTTCPQSGMPGFDDWGFEVVKAAGFLLAHGAHFVYTADDAFNPSADPEYPGMIFPLPGPGESIAFIDAFSIHRIPEAKHGASLACAGMFAEMLKKIMYPEGRHSFSCAGKGGNVGRTFMMEAAIEMLRAQGHSGDRSKIMMVHVPRMHQAESLYPCPLFEEHLCVRFPKFRPSPLRSSGGRPV